MMDNYENNGYENYGAPAMDNGVNNLSDKVTRFIEGHEVIPVCPEVMGGLPTPRVPSEIVNGVVTMADGRNVDTEFRKGAQIGLNLAKENGVDLVILQSRSPSCGVKQIYDGTFSGNKIDGQGIFARLLTENGFRIVDVEDLDD